VRLTTLLVGFDSAWTSTNAGAIVAVLDLHDGSYKELGPPRIVDYPQAEDIILKWQSEFKPVATIVLLDQPTIVKNPAGQRPVENIVASAVSLRYGGMQPANTSREEMFGTRAPMWPFLTRFGGPANPMGPATGVRVFETYPVLALISLLWTLPCSRIAGRLPKYNPGRRKTFSSSDWQFVCKRTSDELCGRGLTEIVRWIDDAARKPCPRKCDQDGVDACLCLLVALYLAEQKDCLLVGDSQTGYIVVPHDAGLRAELETRCNKTGRAPSEWVRVFSAVSERVMPSRPRVAIQRTFIYVLPRRHCCTKCNALPDADTMIDVIPVPDEDPIVVRSHHKCVSIPPDQLAAITFAGSCRGDVRVVPVELLT
jgi:predicted RNase H-like nuclease